MIRCLCVYWLLFDVEVVQLASKGTPSIYLLYLTWITCISLLLLIWQVSKCVATALNYCQETRVAHDFCQSSVLAAFGNPILSYKHSSESLFQLSWNLWKQLCFTTWLPSCLTKINLIPNIPLGNMTSLKIFSLSSNSLYRPNSRQVSLWLLAGLYLLYISMLYQYWSRGLQECKTGES